MTPEFLAIGYITKDFIRGREQPGGSALYGAKCAQKLGYSAAILTSAEAKYPGKDEVEGLHILRTPSNVTTTFTHVYDSDGSRRHVCEPIAPTVDASILPGPWRDIPRIVITPNWNEVSPEIMNIFSTDWIALAPQGWFRDRDSQYHVSFGRSKWNQLPRKIRLTVVSHDDLRGDPDAWNWIKEYSQIAVKTFGKKGHLIAIEGKEVMLEPPYLAKEVDPTGAGDVFAASMLIALKEGADPREAAQFGSVAASFAVEAPSYLGVPTRNQIEKRLREAKAPLHAL